MDAVLRRFLDVTGACVLLVVLGPLLLALAALVRATSRGPAFFVQERVGRDGRAFGLLKLRTMVAGAPRLGPSITVGGDPRITRVGALLRRTKLDELPQLLNVVRGDMSLVGPRPEVPEWVARYTPAQRAVLRARPGITDPASLAFADESALLAGATDPERYYGEVLVPQKLALSLAYLERRSVWTDIGVLVRTALRLLLPGRGVATARGALGGTAA